MKKIEFSDVQIKHHFILHADHIGLRLPSKPVEYYRHGWQSWSLAAWTGIDPIPVQKPDIFHPLQTDPLYVQRTEPHGSWVGAVKMDGGKVLLLGALGTDAHVFLNDEHLTGRYESGSGDWFICTGDETTVFTEYANELGARFGRIPKHEAPRVWCSWYSLYTAIDEKILFETIEQIGDLQFDVVQVDDGWQAAVGDWIPNGKFPSGMTEMAGRIKKTGRTAGLWLAPLLAVKSSRLFRENPDWFLRDHQGRYVSAGFNWGERLYALDCTLPAVTGWLVTLMQQVRAWGFEYLKLDFLYAGALYGKRHLNLPREAAYRETLRTLRQAMGGDAFFLACGTPILPALGLCDAIRIGPDVAHLWEKHRDAVLLYNPTTPAARNAIRTAFHRLWLKPLLHIDSDVAYFSGKENGLTGEQKGILQDIALLCNFKATSDLPQWLTPEEREQLRSFLTRKPRIIRLDQYQYLIDERLVDFSRAVQLPSPAAGWQTLWAAFLGWLGSFPIVLKIIKQLDDRALMKRRKSLDR